MHRYLRIVVPAVQVSAVLCLLGWERLAHTERTLSFYVLPLRHTLLNLNFPLVILWWPIIEFIEVLSGYLAFLSQQTGMLAIIAAGVTAVGVISSVALFWYFVVVEIQMRSKGKSLVNSSNVALNFAKVSIFFLCGVGTFIHAYSETIRLFQHGLAPYGLWPAEIVLGALLLTVWGTTFIGVSIADFRKLTAIRKDQKSVVQQ